MRVFRKGSVAVLTVAFLAIAVVAYAASGFTKVKASRYDPAGTFLVQAAWISGIGCPDGAMASSNGVNLDTPVSESGCANTTDPTVQGLLLAKNGPTPNYAAAQATLSKVKNTQVTELGFDILKSASITGAQGSHCGAGAPRFDVTTLSNVTYFVGCSSTDTPAVVTVGDHWLNLVWGGPGSGNVLMADGPSGPTNIYNFGIKSVSIIYDEGTDTGPDNLGMAVLDNIDYNGAYIGHS